MWLSQQNSGIFARNLQLSMKTFSFPAINLKLSECKAPIKTLPAIIGLNDEIIGHIPIGSMVLLYMVTWIPSIDPSHVSIFLPAPWIRHGIGHRMNKSLRMEVLRAFPIAEFTASTPCTVAGRHPASGRMVSLKDLFKGIAQAIFFWGK